METSIIKSIREKLKRATTTQILEERKRVAAEFFNEAVSDKVPGISKWHSEPSTIRNKKHYSYRHPGTKHHYTIYPSVLKGNKAYHTMVHDPTNNRVTSLGTHTSPDEASEAARNHHLKVLEENYSTTNLLPGIQEAIEPFMKPKGFAAYRHSEDDDERKYGHHQNHILIGQLRRSYLAAKKREDKSTMNSVQSKLRHIGVALADIGLA